MGGVFSQAQGYTDLLALSPGLAFHTLCMGLGAYLVGRAAATRRAALQK